jgi:hypothetical protein
VLPLLVPLLLLLLLLLLLSSSSLLLPCFPHQVFGCRGTGASDAVIAALQKAVDDGMDIINLSLGQPSGWAVVSWHPKP